ncbi:MAG TPA: hypothetical protein VHL53_14475 [Acidimicrobiia bacterium]|nr:hypothetical protein [Acidimicrobiia bacterium]
MPATWVPLDLDPATRVRGIAGLLDPAAPAEVRRRSQALLEATTYQAAKAGAVLAYLFSSVREGKLAAASLLVSVVEAAPDAEATNPGPAAVVATLADRYGGTAGELSAGPAARLRRRRRVEPQGGLPGGDAELVYWYVPHETGRCLALLTFSTPNVELADEFGEIFDAIAGTLRWTA